VKGHGQSKGQLRGAAAFAALEDQGRLFCYPSNVAAIIGLDIRTVYRGIESGDIPCTRIGQRHQIPVAWLRRQVEGADAAGPERRAS
jgi:hypothetical protein